MATYKVIQDIEAEDKILGPLTLRQFIFALIAVFMFYICFILVAKHILFLLILFLPPALFFGFFALPFGRDQPTEVWALAKLRFWFKPRKRIWNQSGVKELVTITVPKKVERVLTNGLSQTEVKSRLKALADTIDSHGWAIKHATNAADAGAQSMVATNSDRLINIDSWPQEVPNSEIMPSDDILDEAHNPIARQFETMIDQSSRSRRQQLMDELNDVADEPGAAVAKPAVATTDNWFMERSQAQAVKPATVASAADDSTLSDQLAAQASSAQVPFGNLRTVQPLAAGAGTDTGAADSSQTVSDSPAPAVTAPGDPAILSLAKNDDFNVATLARQARKNQGDDGQLSDEVVISLH